MSEEPIASDNPTERQEQRVSPTLAAITRAQAERRATASEEGSSRSPPQLSTREAVSRQASICGQFMTSSSKEVDDMDLSLNEVADGESRGQRMSL